MVMKKYTERFRISATSAGRHLTAFFVALFLITPQGASAADAYLQAGMAMPAPSGAQKICQTYAWACAKQGTRRLGSEAEMAIVRDVNRRVNTTTPALSDERQYSRSELWSLPTRAGGDCEDFALLKKRELVRLGVDPRRLLLATVLDRRRVPHAVLVYRSPKGDLLLDNLTDKVVGWRSSGYVFLRMQNPDRPDQWVGGFRA